jgi:restriction endonuclease Mrr
VPWGCGSIIAYAAARKAIQNTTITDWNRQLHARYPTVLSDTTASVAQHSMSMQPIARAYLICLTWLFITSSSFAATTYGFDVSIERKIGFIDGDRLSNLMIHHNLGVTTKSTTVTKETVATISRHNMALELTA